MLLTLESNEIFLGSFSPNKTSKLNKVAVTIFLSFISSDIISIFTSIKKLEKLNKSPFSNNYKNNLNKYLITYYFVIHFNKTATSFQAFNLVLAQ